MIKRGTLILNIKTHTTHKVLDVAFNFQGECIYAISYASNRERIKMWLTDAEVREDYARFKYKNKLQ